MSAVGRLTLTGLRRRGIGQIVVLVVVAALAAAAIVAGLAAQSSAGDLVDAAYERAGRPDLVLEGPADDLRRASTDPAIAAAGEPRPTLLAGTVSVDDDPIELAVTGVDPSNPGFGQPELVEGRWPAAGRVDEIVVERSLLDEGVTTVGGPLTIVQADGPVVVEVVGAAIDLTDCFWPNCDPLRAFATPEALTAWNSGVAPGRFIAVYRLVDPDQAAEVESRIRRDPSLAIDGSNTWPDTRDDILVIGGVFSAMVGGFGFFLLSAACLVVAGATAARLVARRRTLGLLKAVGFTPGQLTASVLGEHLVLGGLGVLAGWVLGSVLAPSVQVGVDGVVGDATTAFELVPLAVAFVLVEAFVALAVLVPAWRAGRQPATEVLRDAPPTPNGGRAVAALARALGARPGTVAGVRRAFARPARAALAGAAVVVATASAINAGGILHSVDRAMADPSFSGDPWDAYAYSTGASAAEIEAGLAELPEAAYWYTEQDANGTVGDDIQRLKVVGGDPDSARYRIQEGRAMRAADEAIVGYGFLEETGLDVGDRLAVEVAGRALDLTIVGWYTEFDDSGEIVQVRAEALAGATIDDPPTWRVVATDGTTREALATAIGGRFGDGVQAVPLPDNDAGLSAVNGAVVALAVILALVAFANLVAVTVTASRERARSLGVLRTIGCTTGQLVGQTAVGAGAIGLAAGVVGVPVGWASYRWLSDTIASGVGIGPGLSVAPTATFLVTVVVGATLLAAAAGALAAAGLARRPVAALVRYE